MLSEAIDEQSVHNPRSAYRRIAEKTAGACRDDICPRKAEGDPETRSMMEDSHRYRLLKPLPLHTGNGYDGGAGGGGGDPETRSMMEDSHRYRLLKPLPLHTGNGYDGGAGGGGVVEHDPKLAAYYRGISKHLDLLSLPAPGDRFTLVQVVGEGTYGEVYAARDKLTDRLVAVKIMENIADNVEEMEEEHRVLRDLCVHPNIPTYFGIFFQPAACREDDQVWFVME
ncbi:hypothetical protein HPB47_023824, partial [Ixodes persulcatus]